MTAELAVGLPVLMVLLFAALTAVSAVTTQLRCVDAAREVARAAARGDANPLTAVRDFTAGNASGNAEIVVSTSEETVRVVVRVRVRSVGGLIPGPSVRAVAVASRERSALP